MIKPGNPKNVDKIKNKLQPNISTKKPLGEERIVLVKPITEESNAYWVPVYCLLHKTDKYATNAEDPKPPEKFSPAIVIIRNRKSAPTSFKST